MNDKHKKSVSKYLSYLLRHHPETIGLELDENGWVAVAELMQKNTHAFLQFTMEDLEDIVATNEKKRFAFNEDHTRIRASQGHSISIDIGLQAQDPPEYLYHGTGSKSVSAIREQGIEKRSRHHVHLSVDRATALAVGSRHGSPEVLTICAQKMQEDGVVFYLSENGVWLTDYVAIQYILK
ncbi:RNA 2'-phosphotransferase [Taibaiella sp. KBW10]|uniref:RNA 2'-phosphotransferase n=1 Tax=Taibaiella sp. KBW10 TaxID=2153357 RepID=UPI000F593FF9|nr:RNA 2'-phosphotransferase [Taibaiella sp. KBW10]RQO32275.1 RNA 2'-phosphotransferase [Taibaiella sp. KBW10]